MEMATGQCDRLIYLADGDYDSVFAMLKVRPDIQKSVEKTLQQCMSETKEILERRCSDVQRIAAALLKNECLTGEEIDKLLSPAQSKLRLLSRVREPEDSYENHMIS